MKKLIVFFAVLLFAGSVCADQVTLTNPESITTPTATKMDWYVSKIDAKNKELVVTYRWRDADDKTIQTIDSAASYRNWYCRDIPAQNPADCTGVGEPYPCCTGVGAGTNCYAGDTCFTNVFGFTIRTQDVGSKIGVGLRTLIWNQFKADVLSAGNTGTFGD